MTILWLAMRGDQNPSGGSFPQSGIEEAIVAVGARQKLAPGTGGASPCQAARRGDFGVGGALEEGLYLIGILFREHRAGGIEQGAARREQRPEVIQQACLHLGELGDI